MALDPTKIKAITDREDNVRQGAFERQAARLQPIVLKLDELGVDPEEMKSRVTMALGILRGAKPEELLQQLLDGLEPEQQQLVKAVLSGALTAEGINRDRQDAASFRAGVIQGTTVAPSDELKTAIDAIDAAEKSHSTAIGAAKTASVEVATAHANKGIVGGKKAIDDAKTAANQAWTAAETEHTKLLDAIAKAKTATEAQPAQQPLTGTQPIALGS